MLTTKPRTAPCFYTKFRTRPRTCIPCHRAGLASGWRLPHWGLPHRRGTRPWGVGRSRAPCRDRCAAVHQHLHRGIPPAESLHQAQHPVARPTALRSGRL